MSLDEVLEQNIAIRGFESVNGDGEYFGNLDESSVEVIKQAILTDLLEIIGEDVNPDEFELSRYKYSIKNQLRQELREKIKAYCE